MRATCCGVTAEPTCNITSSGTNRVSPIGGMPEPGGSGMAGRSISRVPGGAPLPPCLPLARLPTSAPPLPPCLLMTGLPVLAPLFPLILLPMSSAGAPNGIWKVKPVPLGESPWVAVEAGIDRAVDRAYNGLPEICAIIGVTATCIWRSLMLSVGTLMVCVNAAETLATLLGRRHIARLSNGCPQ